MKTLRQIQIEAIGMKRHSAWEDLMKIVYNQGRYQVFSASKNHSGADIGIVDRKTMQWIAVYELTNYGIKSWMKWSRFYRIIKNLTLPQFTGADKFLVVSYESNLDDKSLNRRRTNPSNRYSNNVVYRKQLLKKHGIELIVLGYQD